jgi:hypothetical protein
MPEPGKDTSIMKIYTFLTEKEGGIYIEQFEGLDINAAVMAWHGRSSTEPGPYDPEGSGINPVTGVRGVWCLSGIDLADKFYLVHIVGPLGK